MKDGRVLLFDHMAGTGEVAPAAGSAPLGSREFRRAGVSRGSGPRPSSVDGQRTSTTRSSH